MPVSKEMSRAKIIGRLPRPVGYFSRPRTAAAAPARPFRKAPPSTRPATDADVAELDDAMAAYKVSSGRMFPTWSETLEVLVNLGYAKP